MDTVPSLPSQLHVWLAMAVASTVLPSMSADETARQFEVSGLVDTSPLVEIENRVLPPCLVNGPNHCSTLPEYYAAENRELVDYFARAHQIYQTKSGPTYRSIALIAGEAGIGKTFIKRRVFDESYSKGEVVKFDIKELYQQWKSHGLAEETADLHCGNVVLNRLLKFTNKKTHSRKLIDLLESQKASFYVIDSLDEVHPDDYLWILNQVEDFVVQSRRDFVQVVVFGRGLAFRDYWRSEDANRLDRDIKLFVLNAPRFQTTGDLLVSDWNSDGYRYKLCWSPAGAGSQEMPLTTYLEWASLGYPQTGKFSSTSFRDNLSLNSTTRHMLHRWAQEYSIVGPMICNLAGNGILREIAENHAADGVPFDETKIKKAYFAAWLNRDGRSSNRPCPNNPQQLELYLRLLEEVATRYLIEGKTNHDGCFLVEENDTIQIDWEGERLEFPVSEILDRSGLKSYDPRNTNAMKYRFEPIWLHRMLVERRRDRQSNAFQRTAYRSKSATQLLP